MLAPGSDQFVQLVRSVLARDLTPCSTANGRFWEFQFPLPAIRRWLVKQAGAKAQSLTIPQLALRLGVKQEVAYHLVRSGIIQSRNIRIGRRKIAVVDSKVVKDFEAAYVSGRVLATYFQTSPKALVENLKAQGVTPAVGPAIDGCRQHFFRRKDLVEFDQSQT
jgi:hypothetical protein